MASGCSQKEYFILRLCIVSGSPIGCDELELIQSDQPSLTHIGGIVNLSVESVGGAAVDFLGAEKNIENS